MVDDRNTSVLRVTLEIVQLNNNTLGYFDKYVLWNDFNVTLFCLKRHTNRSPSHLDTSTDLKTFIRTRYQIKILICATTVTLALISFSGYIMKKARSGFFKKKIYAR